MPALSPVQQIAYRTEAIAQFELKEALLRDTVTIEDVDKGETATFAIYGLAGKTAVTRDLNGLIPGDSINRSQVTAIMHERHFVAEHTDFDVFASQSNTIKAMQQGMSVIYRDHDKEILTALDAGSGHQFTSAGLSLQDILKSVARLATNKAAKDITAVITPAASAYLHQIDSFTSADYIDTKVFGDSNAMMAFKWMGVKFIVHPELTGVGTSSAKLFVYAKEAVGHAIARGKLDFTIDFDNRHAFHYTRASSAHAAIVLQPAGVVEITHDDTGMIIA
jgi:hypothetical protein